MIGDLNVLWETFDSEGINCYASGCYGSGSGSVIYSNGTTAIYLSVLDPSINFLEEDLIFLSLLVSFWADDDFLLRADLSTSGEFLAFSILFSMT